MMEKKIIERTSSLKKYMLAIQNSVSQLIFYICLQISGSI